MSLEALLSIYFFLQNKMQHLHATIIYIKNENQHFSVSPPPTPRQSEMQVEDGKESLVVSGIKIDAKMDSVGGCVPFTSASRILSGGLKSVKTSFEN